MRDIDESSRFEAAFRTTAIGVAVVAPDGSWLEVNDALCRILGYSRGDLLARTFQELTHPDDLHADSAARTRMVAGEQDAYLTEKRYVRADGTRVWARLSVSVVRAQDGTPACFVSLIEDIGDRKEAEAMVARLARHFDLSHDLTVTCRFEGVFVDISPRFGEVLGWSPDELRAQPAVAFVHPDDRAATEAAFAALGRGEVVEEFRNRYAVRDGGWRWLEWSARGVLEEQLIYASARDVTERVELELRMEDARVELQRSHRELDQFASVAAHDLKEPISVVHGLLERLRARHGADLGPDAGAFVAHALDAVARMQSLLDDLLRRARLGAAPLRREPVDVGALLETVLADLHLQTQREAGVVEVAPMPIVWADRDQLRQLFQNLLSNALKFRSAEPPRVSVVADRADAGWRFTVVDNGTGIDPHRAAQVFEMFERAHPERYEGTGIGLTICRQVVERHGGTIAVEPVEPHGTRFTFTLPERREARSGAADPPPQAAGPANNA